MEIIAEKLGKRFNRDWIFRNLDLTFRSNEAYAITGPNGSGKSTLLQVLSALMPHSEGKVSYQHESKNIPAEDIYSHISVAAPYLEVIEEFTLKELIDFHSDFKPLKVAKEELVDILGLRSSLHKEIRFFSSGMKTRVKLGLAFYSRSPILLLDEPTSNLDAKGIEWYKEELKKNIPGRLVIVCSNQEYEYEGFRNVLKIDDYKPAARA